MKKVLLTHTSLNSFIIQPESYGATVDEGFIVGGPVGDFELLLCHGTVCVVGKMRDLILQLSKSSIYSTKPFYIRSDEFSRRKLIIRDEIKISFPINIEMSVYSQKENQE